MRRLEGVSQDILLLQIYRDQRSEISPVTASLALLNHSTGHGWQVFTSIIWVRTSCRGFTTPQKRKRIDINQSKESIHCNALIVNKKNRVHLHFGKYC